MTINMLVNGHDDDSALSDRCSDGNSNAMVLKVIVIVGKGLEMLVAVSHCMFVLLMVAVWGW